MLFAGINHHSKAQCSENVLEAFGAVSAIALYNTYITIGTVADGYVEEVYESDYVITLMSEQESMIEILTTQLQSCIDDTEEGHLNEDDKSYLISMTNALDHLKNEAVGLSNFARTNSDDALSQYSDSRDLAWKEISIMLGIE